MCEMFAAQDPSWGLRDILITGSRPVKSRAIHCLCIAGLVAAGRERSVPTYAAIYALTVP
jgi:hypothetical protein